MRTPLAHCDRSVGHCWYSGQRLASKQVLQKGWQEPSDYFSKQKMTLHTFADSLTQLQSLLINS